MTKQQVEAAARALWKIGNARIGERPWESVAAHYMAEAATALEAAEYLAEQTEVLISCEQVKYRISMGHLLPMDGGRCRLCGVPSFMGRAHLREKIAGDPDFPCEAGPVSQEPPK
jgi:hypothetical protein